MSSSTGGNRDANAAARVEQALALRRAGVSYEAIARQCGYGSRAAAYTAVQRELKRTLQEPADALRLLELERLNDLYRAMAPKALKGDTWSVDRCLAIMERRAKLMGLDTPTDSGSSGGQIMLVAVAADIQAAI